ncbi:MAG: type II secretion system protein [Sulfuricurvum sp.]|uniref:type II secretion system protein n=1 Tax=Sulfuricurvum sp. TaxID=2025608 RepID=UPI002619BC2B|nr:type II secretion system protein [Sulfuricurvum sp.]MDD5159264.1 type II secretion system protein [Sulfuricurvum sp.]
MKFRNAFTMTELIFVIVVLGILASVAIPRIGSSITDAQVARGTADVAAIRSAILAERQRLLLQGVSSFVPDINDNFTASETNTTRRLLTYPLKMDTTSGTSGTWLAGGDGVTFTYQIDNANTVFTYTPATGRFDCTSGTGKCDQLTK